MGRAILISVISFPIILLGMVGLLLLLKPAPQPHPKKVKATLTLKEQKIKVRRHVKENLKKKNWTAVTHTLDSLFTVIDVLQDSLKHKNRLLDSLKQDMAGYQKQFAQLREEIEKWQKKYQSAQKRQNKLKDIAKTLSGLKTKDMARIVAKMDDRTLVEIYNQMSTTSKKQLLAALSADRAAALAKKIIKTN